MSLPSLVQPLAHGRLSGGYLYNAKMAEHGAWELCGVAAADLVEFVACLVARPVLLDSIWLTPDSALPSFASCRGGGRAGVMLHSFPSMAAAAESGGAPLSRR